MAIRLEIDGGDNRGCVDYTRYLASPSRSPLVLRDRVNLPALLDLSLVPADAYFLPPHRSAYVRLTGLADALPPGGPRVPGAIFTGYVTSEPVIEYLGLHNGSPLYGYRLQATSEEYLLNIKRIGVLPPFLNQTAGQILRMLAERLQPGRFDTNGIADGGLVPYYLPNPDTSWSEVARELAERSGFYFRVLDGKIYFQPIGDSDAGISVNEKDRNFRPLALEVSPLGNPIQNDVTILGDIEPQSYIAEYFVGDGFISRFPLAAPVHGAESSRLLADDFTGVSIDSAVWQEADPGSCLSIFENRLNITGGTGNLGETTLLAQQAIELGGELEFLHGEFEFTAASTGIIGGLYSDAVLSQANCLLGFDASPIAGTTRLRPLVLGSVQAAEVIVQAGHHYVLITRLSADQPYRTQQTFTGLGAIFGGAAIPAIVRATFEIRDIDTANPAANAVTVLYQCVLTTLPAFAFYAPINSADLHAVVNFLQITRPIQACLETTIPGESPRIRALGFGVAGQDATITSDPNQNQWALEFYEDTIPARGEKITLRYRAAGRARAHVRNAASVAAEASLAGDDGVRAAVLAELNPMPRTAEEAELAAQAYLIEHTAPRFEGRYTTWGEFADSFPRSGRRLDVHDESRYPIFTALVRSVTSEFHELATERIEHTLEFGQPSRFEELLRQFSPKEHVIAPREEITLASTDSAQIGTLFITDAPGISLSSVFPAYFTVDMGAPPPAGGSYEVRRSDSGWGSIGTAGSQQNLIGNFSSQSFALLRAARNHVFYIRPVASDGRTSRFSSVLAVHYPLTPACPQSLNIVFAKGDSGQPVVQAEIVLMVTGLRDVDRVELRDADDATVLARWDFGQLLEAGNEYRAVFEINNSILLLRMKTLHAYTQNALGEYSTARTATASRPEPTKPSLSPGNSVGQILEILLDHIGEEILETQIQVVGPGGDFSAPSQSALLPGQPDKFNFVATSSGAWTFRARRRDALGWSPWSNESQGQLPAESMVFAVQFFQARELDPSIGAAVNAQTLLPNGDFFLLGIAGQEGVNAPRYFALANAASNGTEVQHSSVTNEIRWNAGVNFGAANPGICSLLSNLGMLFNPGEPLTISAALRHAGTGMFPFAVRFALRSASTPAYDQTKDAPAGTIGNSYQWCTATFTLPANQVVPADLSVELTAVVTAGQSLASELLCDKLILNRGHRPAAFSISPWDALGLAWNAGAAAYDLPATALAVTQRGSDAGNAGRLSGTGTEDLDPDFTTRFVRLTA